MKELTLTIAKFRDLSEAIGKTLSTTEDKYAIGTAFAFKLSRIQSKIAEILEQGEATRKKLESEYREPQYTSSKAGMPALTEEQYRKLKQPDPTYKRVMVPKTGDAQIKFLESLEELLEEKETIQFNPIPMQHDWKPVPGTLPALLVLFDDKDFAVDPPEPQAK